MWISAEYHRKCRSASHVHLHASVCVCVCVLVETSVLITDATVRADRAMKRSQHPSNMALTSNYTHRGIQTQALQTERAESSPQSVDKLQTAKETPCLPRPFTLSRRPRLVPAVKKEMRAKNVADASSCVSGL